ncbi:hypothetical protein [Delftia acidovorans]|nr:hypothetical protein [Delftia acidovorans]MBJ2142508.1 hypothetical protein [Delftia acidovorans]QQB52870.1 hypothetical protein I6H54_11650 [Delftia acidovorans]
MHDTNLGGTDRVPHEESACAKLVQAGGHHYPVAHMQQVDALFAGGAPA